MVYVEFEAAPNLEQIAPQSSPNWLQTNRRLHMPILQFLSKAISPQLPTTSVLRKDLSVIDMKMGTRLKFRGVSPLV
jgi:hypothetical protein